MSENARATGPSGRRECRRLLSRCGRDNFVRRTGPRSVHLPKAIMPRDNPASRRAGRSDWAVSWLETQTVDRAGSLRPIDFWLIDSPEFPLKSRPFIRSIPDTKGISTENMTPPHHAPNQIRPPLRRRVLCVRRNRDRLLSIRRRSPSHSSSVKRRFGTFSLARPGSKC